jgi:hypothetical protein
MQRETLHTAFVQQQRLQEELSRETDENEAFLAEINEKITTLTNTANGYAIRRDARKAKLLELACALEPRAEINACSTGGGFV